VVDTGWKEVAPDEWQRKVGTRSLGVITEGHGAYWIRVVAMGPNIIVTHDGRADTVEKAKQEVEAVDA
jgi:hypothetical protein